MKDKRIIQAKFRAERDLSISSESFRLFCRLASKIYSNPHAHPEDSFPLSWHDVSLLTGAKSKQRCYEIIYELLPHPGVSYGVHRKSYLKRADDKAEGCPPTRWFKLNL